MASQEASKPAEVDGGRFAFGRNWAEFLKVVDDDRIKAAQDSLESLLGELSGKTVLDIGSGSGLFSLAARRLGAVVRSFDFDRDAVACTEELKRRYLPADPDWTIEHGNVLDRQYLGSLEQFDIVYSWGVLHHTGSLWGAIANAARLVKPGGLFFISIYNDQGRASRRWSWVKKTYNDSGPLVRELMVVGFGGYFETRRILARLFDRQNPFVRLEGERGMLFRTDLVDWIGGWPFEVATPDAVFDYCRALGFSLEKLKTRQGLGCNEFVFRNHTSLQRYHLA